MVHVYYSQTSGPAQAKNIGVNRAAGDFLMFADAHLQFQDHWGPKIIRNLQNERNLFGTCISDINNHKTTLYGYRWKNLALEINWIDQGKKDIFEVPFVCGCCMFLRKKLFDEIGKFDSNMINYGTEDTEFCLRVWLYGHRVSCVPSLRVYHQFRNRRSYNVDYVDRILNRMRLAFSHFKSERLAGYFKDSITSNPFCFNQNINDALVKLMQMSVLEKREEIFRNRLYTDDWFFEKFPVEY